ncbi:MAG TPA: PQQ-dependent sugar dehydrogenase [Gammaproteobacteria bacterium]|nr:PQQ-dependent sugar dehydrogenase [Gammaproteobacteria bacterium]
MKICLLLALLLFYPCSGADDGNRVVAEDLVFSMETVHEGLVHPWSMCFLPDGKILVTERPGRLRLIDTGKRSISDVQGLPEIAVVGQGGLLDVALHPDFKANKLVYLSYAAGRADQYGTEVIRGKLNGSSLADTEVVFRALPKQEGGRHFGSRLLFVPDGSLFISLGDRGQRDNAQDHRSHAGSLIRVRADGSVPADNPFINETGYRPEIYTTGNRNMQGMALHPATGEVWTHEHGPQGGDEINIMHAGHNYGWPVITYGKNYVIGTDIGEGTHKEGMDQPVHYWVPSIAPSGMVFYTGDEFPAWRGNILVGSLKFGLLVRLVIEDNRVVHEERLLNGRFGRIRDVRQGPEGAIYLLTDEQNGKLLRLKKVR